MVEILLDNGKLQAIQLLAEGIKTNTEIAKEVGVSDIQRHLTVLVRLAKPSLIKYI